MLTCTYRRSVLAAALTLVAGACSLDVTNPNAATDEAVLHSAAGQRALAIGMQGRLGNALEEATYVPALVSGELGNTNATQSTTREFQHFPTPSANSLIDPTNVDLADLWNRHYAVVKSANDILDNIADVPFDPGTRSGIVALARLHKAMAFGTLIEAFEQIPIATNTSNPAPFEDRATVLAEVLSLLAAARSEIETTPPSADFNTNILSPGLDLLNTIRAMQARYSLAAGNYADAVTFANEVPPSATSVMAYTTLDVNALRNLFYGTQFFGAISAWRDTAEAGDARVNQFTTATSLTGFGGATLVQMNIYRSDTSPIPLFTQDELLLIRAEGYARQSQLPAAIAAVDSVRVRNGLAAKTATVLTTQQLVLDEIFRQRTYSLFVMGLHWADLRRFGLLSQAKVGYLPYPFAERATNPNVPADPPQQP